MAGNVAITEAHQRSNPMTTQTEVIVQIKNEIMAQFKTAKSDRARAKAEKDWQRILRVEQDLAAEVKRTGRR